MRRKKKCSGGITPTLPTLLDSMIPLNVIVSEIARSTLFQSGISFGSSRFYERIQWANFTTIAVMPLTPPSTPTSQAKPRGVMETEKSGPESLIRGEEPRLGEGFDFCFDFMQWRVCQTV